jgi:sulfatase maturation enzyme AslB (radical SAM superfamily)
MEISSLKYQNEIWNVKLPSIRAYTFENRDIDEFIKNGEVPLDFDTNLINGCNCNCKYCATQGGKSDVRFSYSGGLPKLTDRICQK